nr:hypothetical protein [Morchella crassipes]
MHPKKNKVLTSNILKYIGRRNLLCREWEKPERGSPAASPTDPYPPQPTASFARIPPPSGGGKNSPSGAAFLHAVRAAPPPRCARGGGIPKGPPVHFRPPPPPCQLLAVVGSGKGGGGCAAGSRKEMQPPPPLIALLKDFSLNFLKKKWEGKGGPGKRGGGGSCRQLYGYPPQRWGAGGAMGLGLGRLASGRVLLKLLHAPLLLFHLHPPPLRGGRTGSKDKRRREGARTGSQHPFPFPPPFSPPPGGAAPHPPPPPPPPPCIPLVEGGESRGDRG